MPIKVAHNFEDYQQNYASSIEDPESFWFEEGKRLKWLKPYTRAKNTDFNLQIFHVRWFEGGVLNVSDNCLDRHLQDHADKIAIIWEGDDPEASKRITYAQLHEEVSQFSNALKKLGVTKGDRVVLYLPMIPEAAVVMLACTRIGAIHSIVFGAFSADSLANRIADCQPKIVITADYGLRGGRLLPFKENVDLALQKENMNSVQQVVVVKRLGESLPWDEARDLWYHEIMADMSTDCPITPMNSEDPLFILYTSGSTGKPKGVLHTTGGYLLHVAMTFQHIFDYKPEDIFWCTADIGWITGHSYTIYGALANGATTLMYEGVPTYPTPARHWEMIDKHGVTIFYTAPTALRSLMREGDDHLKSTTRASLRLLGSVGEPIDPTTWDWYYTKVGHERCPIVDTWWQTETGGILLSPLPGVASLKPGSASFPFYGIQPVIVDEKGKVLEGAASGQLLIKDSWPGQARTLYGDQERYLQTYFTNYPGNYVTGDGASRDEDGYYWITGRIDDVINVSGHRLGTAEIEAALVSHEAVVESAVVGFPHDIKGQGIYAYVVLQDMKKSQDEELLKSLVKWVRTQIGPLATIDHIQITNALPKTRSGKVMRRILRKIAANEVDDFGDTSTLLDPTILETLVKNRKNV